MTGKVRSVYLDVSKQKWQQAELNSKEDFIQGYCHGGERQAVSLSSAPLKQRMEGV